MKLQPDRVDVISVTAHDLHWIEINRAKFAHSMLISHDGTCQPWHCQTFDELTALHFQAFTNIDTDILLLGSGSTQRFVPQTWLVPLSQRQIGVESMDTAAACRTFNILSAEGRKVTAILLLASKA